jgi:hypothetical protein
MNTEHLSQHLHNVLLTLILATNILVATLLFKEGSPSLLKPSQARAEGSGLRKLQQEQEEYGYAVDGDVAFSHRGSSSSRRSRARGDALYLFADVAWQENVANGVFDALDKNNNGRLDFCDMREMFFDGRGDLLVLILNQRSLQVGGVGFTGEDFDFENLFDEGGACGEQAAGQPLIIPDDNEDIFPEGRGLESFVKVDWWEFMQEGLSIFNPRTHTLEPINTKGFLVDYSNEAWRNAFPGYSE